MSHHARGNRAHFAGMASRGTASLRCDTQVARISEAHVLFRLAEPCGIGALGQSGTLLESQVARRDMRLFLCLRVFGQIRRNTCCDLNIAISAVAVGAAEKN